MKKQRHYFADKGPSSQSCGFPMYGCESWAIKKLSAEELMLSNCGLGKDSFVLSPLDNMEIQPVHPKGDQSWVFIGRTDWSPSLWLPNRKS